MKNINKFYIYKNKLVKPYKKRFLKVISGITYLTAILFLLTIIYENGFLISGEDREIVNKIYDYVWSIFMVDLFAKLLMDYSDAKVKYKVLTWVISLLFFLTLIPVIFSEPAQEFTVHAVWSFFNSKLYHIVILTLLSFLKLSNGIVLLLDKRVNPSLIFSGSFFIIIMAGAGLLMLPRATYNGISFIDALFTSTSATCVTGLSTLDVPTTFTNMGLFFIMILIQIGGLGVMTLTSFFAVFFMSNTSFYNQLMMCDMVSSKSLNSLLSTLLFILGFTLVIESIGAAIIFMDIHGTLDMTLNQEIFFSIFHSISAFCNAGFSTLSNNLGNSMLMTNHNTFYLTISFLVILGGIGFPILVNLYENSRFFILKIYNWITKSNNPKYQLGRSVHKYDLNTTIVLITTGVLLLVGFVVIAYFEWNNGFASMPVVDKLVHSFLNSVSPRTAGFSSVAISSFTVQTTLLIIVLMVIGGGAQSTAGGIKVNVFTVILLNIKSILYSEDNVSCFRRELSHNSIKMSNATLIIYMMFIFIALFALTILEPEASLLALAFESISALSTVGASLDLTPSLGSYSKLIIIVLMFVGRIGVLSIMSTIIKEKKVKNYRYPSGSIIIN